MASYKVLLISYFSLALLTVSCQKREEPPVEPVVPEVGKFTQLVPKADQKQVSRTPVFQWETAANAVNYALVVSMRPDYSNPVIDLKNLTTTNHTVGTELPTNTRYFWKVTATNTKGDLVATNAGLAFRTVAVKPQPSPGIRQYFVAPDGEDNPGFGTAAKPFRTLAYAATMVPADEGDTIRLAAGTYSEKEPALIPVGVSVIGAGESSTILSSAGVTLPESVNAGDKDFKLWYDGSLIQLVSDHRRAFRNPQSQAFEPALGNQVLRGFTIDGNNKQLKAGIWVENRNNVTLRNVTIRNTAQRGAVFAPGVKWWFTHPEYYMTGIKIHDCTFINCAKDLADETLGNLCIGQLDGAEVYNIRIDDNEGYGIKFMYDGYFKNCRIHDCNITVNESDSKWGEDIAIELWNLGPGNQVYNIICNTWLSIINHPDVFGTPTGYENVKIYNVRMIDRDGNSSKEGIEMGVPGSEIYNCYIQDKGFGIAVWEMGRKNILIHHNIFYNTTEKSNWAGGPGIYIDNSKAWTFSNIKIYNNLFDTHRIGVRMKGDKISDIDLKNNIFLSSSVAEVEAVGPNITATHNLKFSTANASWVLPGVTTQTANLSGAPGLLNTGDRWSDYYKPAPGSIVLGKGVDVGLPFQGSAPNIGPL